MKAIFTLLVLAAVAAAGAIPGPGASESLNVREVTPEELAIECGDLGVMEVPAGEDPAKVSFPYKICLARRNTRCISAFSFRIITNSTKHTVSQV